MNKMEKRQKRQKLVEYINSMGVEEKIALHNAYCDAVNCMGDCIYAMDDLEEILDGVDMWELVRMIRFGDIDFSKDFWGFDGYGNLESYTARELPVFASEIADYVLSSEDAMSDYEIENILKEEEDNE